MKLPTIHLLLVTYILFQTSSFSQTIDYDDLEIKISNLNDQEKYEESIIILDNIINDQLATHQDKAHAFIQKSFTYKRLLNYSVALKNLDLAEKEAEQSSGKEKLLSKIWAERMFVYFDFQKNDEVHEILEKFDDHRINHLEKETRAFFYSVKGTLALREGKFDIAEENYDKGIEILKKEYPKHLPNLYRSKVSLYSAMKEHDKVLESYHLGIEYAEKYHVNLYKFTLQEAIQKYYGEIGDFENAYKSFLDLRESGSALNTHNRSGDLMYLENILLDQRKAFELENKQKQQSYLLALLLMTLVLLIISTRLLIVTNQKKKLTEKENEYIRAEVERLSKELSSSKASIETFDLTERHKEIIELVNKGLTNREIGEKLFISENTVKYHLKSIYEILGVQNRIALKNQYQVEEVGSN